MKNWSTSIKYLEWSLSPNKLGWGKPVASLPDIIILCEEKQLASPSAFHS